ncbi:MAG: hypothetical protein ABII12_05205 [Planctomycetota bacterium]
MGPKLLFLSSLFVVPSLMAWPSEPPEQVTQPAVTEQDSPADLVVTLEHVGGKSETFKDEVVCMELILGPSGQLRQVHLITKSSTEADTHIWYNVDNLVCVKYQFLAITGKGRVSVRTITPPAVKTPTDASKQEVAPLDPEDYR